MGSVSIERKSDRSTRVCAEVEGYVRICLELQLEPLSERAEERLAELLELYEGVIVKSFERALRLSEALAEIAARPRSSEAYM
ncbi:MAG: hypothetical protein QXU52_01635 [Fervidicoccaceae archaeon]